MKSENWGNKEGLIDDGSIPPGEEEAGLNRDRINLGNAGDVTDSEGMEHIEGFLVDLDVIGVDGGDIGDEVHAAFALLLLQFERDTANRALLNALHEISGEACDLIPESFRGDDRHFFQKLLVRVEVQRHPRIVTLDHLSWRFLHRLCSHTAHLSSSVAVISPLFFFYNNSVWAWRAIGPDWYLILIWMFCYSYFRN